MRKIFFSALGFFLSVPAIVGAQDFTTELEGVRREVGYEAETSLADVVGRLINVALSILGVILLVFVIYAGFLWMTAGGDSSKTERAKSFMINATIGLVIILAAYAISNFVITALTSAGLAG